MTAHQHESVYSDIFIQYSLHVGLLWAYMYLFNVLSTSHGLNAHA